MDGFTTERKQRFSQGVSDDAYRFMGVHLIENVGYIFRVWAPNARSVRLVGDFNYWNTSEIMMQPTEGGIWEAVSAGAKEGDKYKYYIERNDGTFVYKSDPYAFRQASLPDTSSIVWDPGGFGWTDGKWPLYIFTGDCGGVPEYGYSTIMRLYYFKVYRDIGGQMVLVRDFVPCLNESGAAGLFDKVERRFYGNARSGVADFRYHAWRGMVISFR